MGTPRAIALSLTYGPPEQTVNPLPSKQKGSWQGLPLTQDISGPSQDQLNHRTLPCLLPRAHTRASIDSTAMSCSLFPLHTTASVPRGLQHEPTALPAFPSCSQNQGPWVLAFPSSCCLEDPPSPTITQMAPEVNPASQVCQAASHTCPNSLSLHLRCPGSDQKPWLLPWRVFLLRHPPGPWLLLHQHPSALLSASLPTACTFTQPLCCLSPTFLPDSSGISNSSSLLAQAHPHSQPI